MNFRNVFLAKCLSTVILKTSSSEVILCFRKYEKTCVKLATAKSHRMFNETCRNNKLLPTYTRICMHVYMIMYAYVCMYVCVYICKYASLFLIYFFSYFILYFKFHISFIIYCRNNLN